MGYVNQCIILSLWMGLIECLELNLPLLGICNTVYSITVLNNNCNDLDFALLER